MENIIKRKKVLNHNSQVNLFICFCYYIVLFFLAQTYYSENWPKLDSSQANQSFFLYLIIDFQLPSNVTFIHKLTFRSAVFNCQFTTQNYQNGLFVLGVYSCFKRRNNRIGFDSVQRKSEKWPQPVVRVVFPATNCRLRAKTIIGRNSVSNPLFLVSFVHIWRKLQFKLEYLFFFPTFAL